jgi:hypothetical protein
MLIEGNLVSQKSLVSLGVLLLLHLLTLQSLDLNLHGGHLSLQVRDQSVLLVFKLFAALLLGSGSLTLLVFLVESRVALVLFVSELSAGHVIVKSTLLHRSS